MKKLWELKYNENFVLNGTKYNVLSAIQRISQTSIIRICVNIENGLLVELNANTEVELISNERDSN